MKSTDICTHKLGFTVRHTLTKICEVHLRVVSHILLSNSTTFLSTLGSKISKEVSYKSFKLTRKTGHRWTSQRGTSQNSPTKYSRGHSQSQQTKFLTRYSQMALLRTTTLKLKLFFFFTKTNSESVSTNYNALKTNFIVLRILNKWEKRNVELWQKACRRCKLSIRRFTWTPKLGIQFFSSPTSLAINMFSITDDNSIHVFSPIKWVFLLVKK